MRLLLSEKLYHLVTRVVACTLRQLRDVSSLGLDNPNAVIADMDIMHRVMSTNSTGTRMLYSSGWGCRLHTSNNLVLFESTRVGSGLYAMEIAFFVYLSFRGMEEEGRVLACGRLRSVKPMELRYNEEGAHRTAPVPKNTYMAVARGLVNGDILIPYDQLVHKLGYVSEGTSSFYYRFDGRLHLG